jgi:glutamine amidotransferase-like uncharacterized protein
MKLHNAVRTLRPIAVAAILVAFTSHCLAQSGPRKEPPRIRVAIFNDVGSLKAASTIEKCLAADHHRFNTRRVTSDEIRDSILADFDIIICGGGSSSKEARTLSSKGRDEVRKFVKEGHGYIGICAGAYLATDDYDWSLGLIKARVVDKKHASRGGGTVRLEVTAEGASMFGFTDQFVLCHYHQGPLLAPRADSKEDVQEGAEEAQRKKDFTPITIFDSEVAEKGAPHGVMVGCTAMATARYGRGRVFVSSPHPESTPGMERMIPLAARWVAKQDKQQDK